MLYWNGNHYICAPQAPIRCHAVSTLRARRCRLAQHDNDVGMENTDEIQGDDEQNNTSFLEGGSVICKEQSIVADGVLFIEDKLTSLEFDNAGNQTSPSDEEFE